MLEDKAYMSSGDVPIFMVGVQRSGTTLLHLLLEGRYDKKRLIG